MGKTHSPSLSGSNPPNSREATVGTDGQRGQRSMELGAPVPSLVRWMSPLVPTMCQIVVPTVRQILRDSERNLPTHLLEQLPVLWVTVECWDDSEGVGVEYWEEGRERSLEDFRKIHSSAEFCEVVIGWQERGGVFQSKGNRLRNMKFVGMFMWNGF